VTQSEFHTEDLQY